jgi:hypothetical protein
MPVDIPRYVGLTVVDRDRSLLISDKQVLRCVRKLKQKTLYSSLLQNNFQVIKFNELPTAPSRSPPISAIQIDSKHLFETITTSLSKVKMTVSADEWDNNGFKNFEILCWTVHAALEDPEEDGRFKRLGLLRAWMFFFDLCVLKDFGLRSLLQLHLYGLVLAMAPYFPSACSGSLEKFCRASIKRMRRGYEVGASPAKELTEVFWSSDLFC